MVVGCRKETLWDPCQISSWENDSMRSYSVGATHEENEIGELWVSDIQQPISISVNVEQPHPLTVKRHVRAED